MATSQTFNAKSAIRLSIRLTDDVYHIVVLGLPLLSPLVALLSPLVLK